MIDTRKQVIDQCRVVSYLAKCIEGVHTDLATIFDDPTSGSEILEQVGTRTASFMEALGGMLNAMDAALEEDEWTHPIFKEAQRRWPQS